MALTSFLHKHTCMTLFLGRASLQKLSEPLLQPWVSVLYYCPITVYTNTLEHKVLEDAMSRNVIQRCQYALILQAQIKATSKTWSGIEQAASFIPVHPMLRAVLLGLKTSGRLLLQRLVKTAAWRSRQACCLLIWPASAGIASNKTA